MGDRYYCPGPWREGRAILEGDEVRHLARVRRVEVGGRVEVFDGIGHVATAEVVAIGRDRAELAIVGGGEGMDLAGTLILASAVPKGDRFDWLVEKATELGVTRLVPIRAERSTVDPRATKLERLRRVVVEACKQSGRARLMTLDEPMDWRDWLDSGSGGAGARLVAHPGGDRLGPAPDLAAGVALAIGPEGGFTGAEVAEAREAGYRAVGLGPTILRVETAAVASCAAVVALGVRTGEGGIGVTGASAVLLMIGVGLGAGVVGGMFGIGGGLIIVPALMLAFGLDQKTATGTSLLAQLLPVALLAVLEYNRQGQVRVSWGLAIAVGLVFGTLLGAKLTGLMKPSDMKRLYGVFLVSVGVYFLFGGTVKPRDVPIEKGAPAAEGGPVEP